MLDRASLQVLGERWTFLILREIFAGRHLFAEIRHQLGVAPNLLSARLRTLVTAGVLERREYREERQRSRECYHLTAAGAELRIILTALEQWGDKHRLRPSGPRVEQRSLSRGTAVQVGFVDELRREVDSEDVVVVLA